MIYDSFANRHRYSEIPFLKELENFVASRDCSGLPDGEYEILGRDLFVRVAEYLTGPADEKQFEAHQVYADFQLIVAGREIMECAPAQEAKPVTDYDSRADIRFFAPGPEVSSLLVSAGQFAFFFPGELHKPGCLVTSTPNKVKKLVFKIKMAQISTPADIPAAILLD